MTQLSRAGSGWSFPFEGGRSVTSTNSPARIRSRFLGGQLVSRRLRGSGGMWLVPVRDTTKELAEPREGAGIFSLRGIPNKWGRGTLYGPQRRREAAWWG